MSSSIAIRLAERGVLPDCLIRFGIRQLAKERLASWPPHNGNDLEAYIGRFVAEMAQSPIAVLTDKANAQHYEVPAEFFELVLGAQRKYSCCLYPHSPCSLDEAEEFALSETAAHAQLADGQTILELGCGWGSLSLWMARHYPNSQILGVSNSQSQRASILERAKREGKYQGRVPTVRRQLSVIRELAEQGLTPPEIAGRLNCSRASVYRLLKEDRA